VIFINTKITRKINVYFNRCFTDTSEVIEELKDNEDKIKYKIFISYPYRNEKLENCSDYYEIEPVIESSEDYAQYCLNFCIKYDIDVFVPRFRAKELSKFQGEFKKLGIKVLFIGSESAYKLLDDKAKVYDCLKDNSIIKIPPFKAVTNYEEFIEAYEYVKNSGFEVCIKPTEGIGAIGYKRIIEDVSSIEELSLSNFQISYNHLKKILSSTSNFDPLLVSGVLPGDEWSIDCLGNNGKLVDSVIRIKSGKYEQTVKVDREINIIVEKLVEKFKLNNLFNIQFKLKDDVIYLLEINTRMSAGIFKSCKIGINFLHKAILKEFDYHIKSEMYNLKDIKIITNTKYKVEKI